MLEEQRCSSCHARILWATTEKSNKPIPLDPEPKVGGNIEIVGVSIARFVRTTEPVGDRLLYVSHFATCPNAAHHRKAAPL